MESRSVCQHSRDDAYLDLLDCIGDLNLLMPVYLLVSNVDLHLIAGLLSVVNVTSDPSNTTLEPKPDFQCVSHSKETAIGWQSRQWLS